MENHLMDMVNSNTAMNCFLQTGMEIAKKFKNKSLVDLANVLYYFDEIPQNVDQAHVWYNMYTEIQTSVMKYTVISSCKILFRRIFASFYSFFK